MDEKSWNWNLISSSASTVYFLKHKCALWVILKSQKRNASQECLLVLQVEHVYLFSKTVANLLDLVRGPPVGDRCSKGFCESPQNVRTKRLQMVSSLWRRVLGSSQDLNISSPGILGSKSLLVEESAFCVGSWSVRKRVVQWQARGWKEFIFLVTWWVPVMKIWYFGPNFPQYHKKEDYIMGPQEMFWREEIKYTRVSKKTGSLASGNSTEDMISKLCMLTC